MENKFILGWMKILDTRMKRVHEGDENKLAYFEYKILQFYRRAYFATLKDVYWHEDYFRLIIFKKL